MPTFKISLEGAPEFQNLLDELANSGSTAGIEGLLTIAEAFVSDAKSDAPVDTGYMADNIEITDETENSVTVESSAPYSGFVDGGTIHQ